MTSISATAFIFDLCYASYSVVSHKSSAIPFCSRAVSHMYSLEVILPISMLFSSYLATFLSLSSPTLLSYSSSPTPEPLFFFFLQPSSSWDLLYIWLCLPVPSPLSLPSLIIYWRCTVSITISNFPLSISHAEYYSCCYCSIIYWMSGSDWSTENEIVVFVFICPISWVLGFWVPIQYFQWVSIYLPVFIIS